MNLDRWNEVLLEDLRARGRAGQRLYLYVDRDLLARLSDLNPADAVDDFCKAFQSATGRQPFKWAADAAVRWKMLNFPGDPSFVAHLAMTVLAVTEDPLGSGHGIYRRQNTLLGLSAEAAAPPGYGEDVPRLWRVWNAWLDGPGSVYGRPSARNHPHWTLQGWARSQGLFRYHDRLRIERFLEDLCTSPSSTPSVAMFRQWLQYRGAGGRDLLEKLEDQAAQEIAQEVLEDESARWGREGSRARLVGRTRGLLQYDDWDGTFSGAIEVDAALYGVLLDVGQGGQYEPDSFDDYLLVTPRISEAQLLREGVDHRLADRVVVRFGGDEVYVMRDEPRVNGRLQCRSLDTVTNYHVLAHRVRIPRLTEALRDVGVAVSPRESSEEGWLWLDNLRLDRDSDLLRLLGLAALVPAEIERPTLEGGLQLAPRSYLVGGEPDLILPSDLGSEVTLDGIALKTAPGLRRINLADRYLGPGVHTVSCERGDLTFHTFDCLKETAASGGVGRAVHFRGEGFSFDEPTRDPDAHTVLAGAALVGVDLPEPLAIRRPAGAECLVLTEAGELYEIWPSSPAWMRRIGLEPSAIDVLDAVRTSASPAAFLIVRNRRSRNKRGVAIPPDSSRMPGRSPCRPRPELIGELVAQRWRWVGEADEARARRVLSLAMKQRTSGGSHASPNTGTPTLRHDVYVGRVPDNPYDDIMIWLAEQENGRVTATRFAETWAWLCRRYTRTEIAGEWRRALATLSMLGHVERDFVRKQVTAAPAALVALPSACGVSALVGARPTRLLERMDDPDDPEPIVAAAAGCWTVHYRTPTDLDKKPIGPCTVYVEWDSAERDAVRAGLTQLGVTMYGVAGTQLLRMHPSLQQAVRAGQPLTMSPGREPWLWRRTVTGNGEWVRRQADGAPGFYRYRLAQGNVFAWRAALGASLVKVEPAIGQWLALAAQGQTSLLIHRPVARTLLVSVTAPLPSLLARALVLRTALPPYRAYLEGRDVNPGYLVYENVDAVTAEGVAQLLQQVLQINNGALRMDR
ncbi:hypothetical protein ABT214_04110 [Micromonospora purpureochromogenes]|uniref:hypothetical protein n=1 Tax=Micromonospora purpureochromogenes TaxID=47872 RepID=UPI003329832E